MGLHEGDGVFEELPNPVSRCHAERLFNALSAACIQFSNGISKTSQQRRAQISSVTCHDHRSQAATPACV